MRQKRIVTMQDLSCFGKCSMSAALSIIPAFGIEAAALPTAILSTHTGKFEGYTFCDLSEEAKKITAHWERLGIVFDAMYTGYLGTVENIHHAAALADKFRSEGTIVFVDPAMADEGELYSGFDEEYADEMRRLCRAADIICPNLTEAAMLTGMKPSECMKNPYAVFDRLENDVILTGVDAGDGKCGVIVRRSGVFSEIYGKKTEGHFYGTGDIFASVFIGAYTLGAAFETAAELAVKFTADSIERTMDEREKYWYGLKYEQSLPMLSEFLKTMR